MEQAYNGEFSLKLTGEHAQELAEAEAKGLITTEDAVAQSDITVEESDEQLRLLAEAASRAGLTCEELHAKLNNVFQLLVKAINEMIPCLVQGITDIIPTFVELMRRYHYVPDELLQPYGTPKELHLMKHSKKYRTRKKYRDRLTRRFEHDRQESKTTPN